MMKGIVEERKTAMRGCEVDEARVLADPFPRSDELTSSSSSAVTQQKPHRRPADAWSVVTSAAFMECAFVEYRLTCSKPSGSGIGDENQMSERAGAEDMYVLARQKEQQHGRMMEQRSLASVVKWTKERGRETDRIYKRRRDHEH